VIYLIVVSFLLKLTEETIFLHNIFIIDPDKNRKKSKYVSDIQNIKEIIKL